MKTVIYLYAWNMAGTTRYEIELRTQSGDVTHSFLRSPISEEQYNKMKGTEEAKEMPNGKFVEVK